MSYTFRKPSNQKGEKDSAPPIKDVYEIPSSGGEDNADVKSVKEEEKTQRHIFVPLPIPASQIKTPVVLRSILFNYWVFLVLFYN